MEVKTLPELLSSSINTFVDTSAPTVSTTATLDVVLKAFSNKVGVVCVTEPTMGKLKGIITGHEFASAAVALKKPQFAIQLAKTTEIVAINITAEVWALLKLMNGDNHLNKWLDFIPVLDKNERFIGLITRSQLKQTLQTYFLAP
jgi:CBS domain-containing protein